MRTIARSHRCLTDCHVTGIKEKVSQIQFNSITTSLLTLFYSFVVVMPPYIDVISNLFSANVMRKAGATAPGGKSGATPAGKTGTKKNLTSTVRSTLASGRTTPYKK